jgi:2-polyprenyl-6-methoxyphenol hydroxylase-like FAD-dependent oxidoreductase
VLEGGSRLQDFQRGLVTDAFAGMGWKIPELIAKMRHATDFYFDTVDQIHMATWSKDHVVLVGDAAYAPSFLTGQGSSLALVGAHVLASELASRVNHQDAFAAYDRKLRLYVELNQATVEQGKAGMIPTTTEQLQQRQTALRALIGVTTQGAETGRDVHRALDLSEYDRLLSGSNHPGPVKS